MKNRYFVLVIDGCAPEYLTPDTAPHIFRLAETYGFIKTIKSAIPTVTNVNHACILSGRFPEDTGVTGNYYYNPDTGEEGFVEERGFMKIPTVLHTCRERGLKTAFLTVKGKVLGVYGEDADIGINAQAPDLRQLESLGLTMPPGVSDPACTEWIMSAALACVRQEAPDFVYCTTNDCCFHHYGPETEEARQQIQWIDYYIHEIHKADPHRQIYITADHGMNQKHRLLNVQAIAQNHGIPLFCLAPLKDRYIENHRYQEGGILYLYLNNNSDRERLSALMESIPEIEMILPSEEAARRYHLPGDSIGDYVIFAAKDCAFGEIDGEYLETASVRTHGSLWEQEIPLAAVFPAMPEEFYHYNKDIAANLRL